MYIVDLASFPPNRSEYWRRSSVFRFSSILTCLKRKTDLAIIVVRSTRVNNCFRTGGVGRQIRKPSSRRLLYRSISICPRGDSLSRWYYDGFSRDLSSVSSYNAFFFLPRKNVPQKSAKLARVRERDLVRLHGQRTHDVQTNRVHVRVGLLTRPVVIVIRTTVYI